MSFSWNSNRTYRGKVIKGRFHQRRRRLCMAKELLIPRTKPRHQRASFTNADSFCVFYRLLYKRWPFLLSLFLPSFLPSLFPSSLLSHRSTSPASLPSPTLHPLTVALLPSSIKQLYHHHPSTFLLSSALAQFVLLPLFFDLITWPLWLFLLICLHQSSQEIKFVRDRK